MSTATPAATPPASKTGNPILDLPIEQVPEEWREHARELRRENASLRALAKQVDDKAAQERIDAAVKAASDAHKAETQALLQGTRDAANKRIIQAEVRAAATALGLKDADGLKLLDTSALTIDDSGDVFGVAELLAEFKKNKPYLFKEAVSDTAQSRRTPDRNSGKPFDARTARPEEIAADAKARRLTLKQH